MDWNACESESMIVERQLIDAASNRRQSKANSKQAAEPENQRVSKIRFITAHNCYMLLANVTCHPA